MLIHHLVNSSHYIIIHDRLPWRKFAVYIAELHSFCSFRILFSAPPQEPTIGDLKSIRQEKNLTKNISIVAIAENYISIPF